jgi:serine phosphatase RsbU (regulator of sigma subunit)
VDVGTPFPAVTVELPPGTTLLAFSDGLVERRGEVVDTGLARLAAVATATGARPLDDTVDRVLDELTGGGTQDDTVLLALRRPAPAPAPDPRREAAGASARSGAGPDPTG